MMQSHFARHLQAGSETPADLIASNHAAMRYAVYRNNVLHSLINALETRFPATRRLIGDESFQFCAKLFVERHKPQTPVLMFYGDYFPDFLTGLAFLDTWPFLPDIARIEVARTYAFHAEDRAAFHAPHLDAGAIDRLLSQRLEPHPAAWVLQSSYPAATIWASSDAPDALRNIAWQAQTLAITRGADDVRIFIVPHGMARCFTALRHGATLEAAIDAACENADACDPAAILAALFCCDLLSAQ
jgi:hypothetical protein